MNLKQNEKTIQMQAVDISAMKPIKKVNVYKEKRPTVTYIAPPIMSINNNYKKNYKGLSPSWIEWATIAAALAVSVCIAILAFVSKGNL